MKYYLFILGFLTITLAANGSPFESTVPGITIGNTHLLDNKGILRGSQPAKKLSELKAWGVTDVIIFKSPTKDEVKEERATLKELSMKSHHIAFRWKELVSPEVACKQVVRALKILRDNRNKNRVTFFHCTVGEDRTGLLAGVWRILDDGLTADEAWNTEMCPNGYADGNKFKPKSVASAIHAELTPLYFALAEKIKNNELSLANFNSSICKNLSLPLVKRTCKR